MTMTRTVHIVACLTLSLAAACSDKKETTEPQEVQPTMAQPAAMGPGATQTADRPTEDECRAAVEHIYPLLLAELPPEQVAEIDAQKDAQIAEGVQSCQAQLTRGIVNCMAEAESLQDAENCKLPGDGPLDDEGFDDAAMDDDRFNDEDL